MGSSFFPSPWSRTSTSVAGGVHRSKLIACDIFITGEGVKDLDSNKRRKHEWHRQSGAHNRRTKYCFPYNYVRTSCAEATHERGSAIFGSSNGA